jgi:hypothetical protein
MMEQWNIGIMERWVIIWERESEGKRDGSTERDLRERER